VEVVRPAGEVVNSVIVARKPVVAASVMMGR
jgi:hypothetical protein